MTLGGLRIEGPRLRHRSNQVELQSRHYVHFRANILVKDMNSFIFTAMGKYIPLLYFYQDSFGFEQSTKADIY